MFHVFGKVTNVAPSIVKVGHFTLDLAKYRKSNVRLFEGFWLRIIDIDFQKTNLEKKSSVDKRKEI